MGKEKIHKTSKKTYIRLGIIIFVVLLLGWLYYQSQRPNYRDLERTYAKLQIPENWEMTGDNSVRDKWGLFCGFDSIDRACPYLSRFFAPPDGSGLQEQVEGLMKSTNLSVKENLCMDSTKSCSVIFVDGRVEIEVFFEASEGIAEKVIIRAPR